MSGLPFLQKPFILELRDSVVALLGPIPPLQ